MSDWTDGISVAQMSRQFTPKQASRVKYRTLLFRSADPEGAKRMDQVLEGSSGHHWFSFCLDAVARREGM